MAAAKDSSAMSPQDMEAALKAIRLDALNDAQAAVKNYSDAINAALEKLSFEDGPQSPAKAFLTRCLNNITPMINSELPGLISSYSQINSTSAPMALPK